MDFEEIEISPDAEKSSDDLDYAITSIYRNGVALKANIEADSGDHATSNVTLRRELDLYVNAVRCSSYPGVPSRHRDVDIVIMRQNTEGEYSMMEHQAVDGVVESMKVISRPNAERIARFAFEYARTNNRKKVRIASFTSVIRALWLCVIAVVR